MEWCYFGEFVIVQFWLTEINEILSWFSEHLKWNWSDYKKIKSFFLWNGTTLCLLHSVLQGWVINPFWLSCMFRCNRYWCKWLWSDSKLLPFLPYWDCELSCATPACRETSSANLCLRVEGSSQRRQRNAIACRSLKATWKPSTSSSSSNIFLFFYSYPIYRYSWRYRRKA